MGKKPKNESDYFKSEEFIKNFKEQVKKETWSKGLPMVYSNDKGQIVKEWENGTIEIIHDNKNSKS